MILDPAVERAQNTVVIPAKAKSLFTIFVSVRKRHVLVSYKAQK
jgi:hypothetical protein